MLENWSWASAEMKLSVKNEASRRATTSWIHRRVVRLWSQPATISRPCPRSPRRPIMLAKFLFLFVLSTGLVLNGY
ncbi:hypothetical protein Hdeb2414_s0001g00031901 [Helianthus debilis subsp. tardiflorus]